MKIRTVWRYAVVGMWLGLGGCVNHVPQFVTPEKMLFRQQIFERVSHSQIDEMQQILYLPQGQHDPNQWENGLLLFLDANRSGQTVVARAEQRKQHFAKQPHTLATISVKANELRSEILYPPTARFADVQLEVSRGRDLACGFGQMQFADKRAVSAKNLQNLHIFQPLMQQLAADFYRLAWQIECQ